MAEKAFLRCTAVLLAAILTAAAAGREPLCPAGFYREGALIWPCDFAEDTRQYETAILIEMASAEELGPLPANLKNPSVQVQSTVQGKFQIVNTADKDMSTHRNILVSQQGKMSYPFAAMTVNDNLVSRVPFQEDVHLYGLTPEDLYARLLNNGTKKAVFRISYTFDGYYNATCPSEIHGCTRYDARKSVEAVNKFSLYLKKEYGNFYWAWQSVEEKYVRQENVENISWYEWQTVWQGWPSSDMIDVDWKETFHFVDVLSEEDGIVSKAEYKMAYSFSTVYPSLSAWSGELHGAVNGKTAAEAWTAISMGETNITHASWKSKWERFLLPADVDKASAEDVLPFFDADGDGVITEVEFSAAYHTFYVGTPILLAGLHPHVDSHSEETDGDKSRRRRTKADDGGQKPHATITVTTVTTVQAVSTDACFFQHTRYEAAPLGHNETAEANDEYECLQRCRQHLESRQMRRLAKEEDAPGFSCAHFSFWNDSHKCELYGEDVIRFADASAVSGTPHCHFAPSTPPNAGGSDGSSGIHSGSTRISGSESNSDEKTVVIVVVASLLVCILISLLSALVFFRKSLSGPKTKKKTFKRDARTQSREVSGFYEPVEEPAEPASGVGDVGQHLQSPGSLQPVESPPADGYYPGPYEQFAEGGNYGQKMPGFQWDTHTPLSNVSLTPQQSQVPSTSSWNYGQAMDPGRMNSTPLRYSMGNADVSPRAGQGDERYGNSFEQRPMYQPAQSSFVAQGGPGAGYQSAQSSFSGGSLGAGFPAPPGMMSMPPPGGMGMAPPGSMSMPPPGSMGMAPPGSMSVQTGGLGYGQGFFGGPFQQTSGFQQPYIGPI